MKLRFSSLLFVLLFISCEKVIQLDVNNQPAKLVVDASIENDRYPKVVLSASLNYFGTITPEQLAASFVHGAEIDISNGTLTQRLKEYIIKDTSGYSYYYYGVDTADASTTFKGELNHTYTMAIKTQDGNSYNTTTTIPSLAKTIDSVWWQQAPPEVDPKRVVLFGRFTDPKGYGNYIRYFTQVNQERFLPGINSVFDDQVVDGKTYDFQIDKGFDKNGDKNFSGDDYGFFHHGDTAVIKFCNIDKATYDFWRTWEFNYQSNGNPFSSPVTVLGNVPNAFGVFSGYAAQYKHIIIPK